MNLLTEIDRLNAESAVREWLIDQVDFFNKQFNAANLKIQALTLELAHHRRIQFGVKSEALSVEQRDLFEESWQEDASALEAAVEQMEPKLPKPRIRAGRQPLPDHLPRIEHRHEPASCQCGQCGADLIKISEDVSEQLDVVPAKFFVHRHIRPQYACRTCETMTAEPVPPAIIDGGMAAPSLLTWVMISKYADHLPLYRLEQIAARSQVPLARSTLADWVGRTGVALQPLIDRLAELLKERRVLHADETPVAQLDPGPGKTRRAYLWTWRSNDLDTGPPIVVFEYQTSRSGKHADSFLGNWRGHLMLDDYSGYKHLFMEQGIIELACWAHAQRKFFDLHTANKSPIAQTALQHIAALYLLEAEAKETGPEMRHELRQQSQQKLTEFHAWLSSICKKVAPGSATAKAIAYTLKRWPALIRYAETGHLPIDNNPVENTIRPIAVGKKNWLFAGSERAGRRAAAIQTLIGTARLNGLDPHAWLKDTLEKLPTWPNSRLDELLPIKRQA
ncbi:MAG: IS66 family transposase [Burkholderiales bacterium]